MTQQRRSGPATSRPDTEQHLAQSVATTGRGRQAAASPPSEVQDEFLEIKSALRSRGRMDPHPSNAHGFITACPIDGCRRALDVHIDHTVDDPDDPDWWVSMLCERGHSDTEISDALGILVLEVLRTDFGAAFWAAGLASDVVSIPPDWAFEPVIELGQFGSIYGPRGVGKSLLALDFACRLSRANSVLEHHSRKRILYLDHENPREEIYRRIKDMGYTPDGLVSLTYLSFPPIRALDSEAGAAEFLSLVTKTKSDVVVLDTWSKFIKGAEADPSTHTNVYNLAIVPVRRNGVTVLALDHSGKDISRGPRGGGSKGDNVDVEWLLTAKTGGRLRLERKKTRTGRGPDVVELQRSTGPLRHERIGKADVVLTPEVRACVAKLDALEVSAGWGRDRASEVLKANDFRVRTETLAAAIKVRKGRGGAPADSLGLSGNSSEQVSGQDQGTRPRNSAEQVDDDL